jgi:lipopolysaccharide/colanic/teichoic acid biosynthesis glycosyltransferase
MTTMYTEQETTGTHDLLIDEGLFKQTITRERKRSERSGRALVLLLVERKDQALLDSPDRVSFVTDTLRATKGDIGILGWVEGGRTIGLIVPEIDAQDVTGVCERLETEFDEAVAHQTGRGASPNLLLTLRVYPEQGDFEETFVKLVDPFLYPELSVDRRTKPGLLFLKRGMDVALSGLLLILLSPLFALIAALVKATSPGPALFRQVRVGYLMKPFMMYKFRTMYCDVDHHVHHNYVSWFITASDQGQAAEQPAVFKLTTDDRITPIGRVLRRTSLDELPQLWNVLVGDMSLVGPRPPLPYEVEQYKPWHRGRVLQAKPGVTGLWQVVGRSRTTFDEMVRLDLRYARTMSLWNDIKIILATPMAMITGKGAC